MTEAKRNFNVLAGLIFSVLAIFIAVWLDQQIMNFARWVVQAELTLVVALAIAMAGICFGHVAAKSVRV